MVALSAKPTSFWKVSESVLHARVSEKRLLLKDGLGWKIEWKIELKNGMENGTEK